ncbi:MAG TPA: caspase family protein, partial [Hyphomicrobiaceae bacterium]|nr:caspase family protein [Hyphomicrobiaceae bacterium]
MLPALLILLAAVLGLSATSVRADDLAVIIANKTYVNSHEVEFAHNDGERFADAARRALLIPEDRVLVFRDQGLAAMRTLVSRQVASRVTTRTKRLWVYYSGHGFPLLEVGRPPEPYLLPVDGDPGVLKETAIALDDVKKQLGALKRSMAEGAEIVLVLEACFSGRSSKGAVQPKVSGSAFNVDLGLDSSILVLSATGEDHVASWDHEAKLGLFTDLLLDTLFGRAGRESDGRITTAHLGAYLDRELQARLARLYPGERRLQRPWLGGRTTASVLIAHGEPLPTRDPERERSETLMCTALRLSGDAQKIAEFVASCRACAEECKAALRSRRSEIERQAAYCRAEAATLDKLLKAKVARAELAGLLQALSCPEVVAKAKTALDQMPAPAPGAPGGKPMGLTPSPTPSPPPSTPAPTVVPPGTAPGTLVRSWEAHGGRVTSAAVSPDGRRIVTGSSDGTLKFWDAATGRELRSIDGGQSALMAVAMSPDGRWVVSSGMDATVKLWDAATWKELRAMAGHKQQVNAVAVSPDGRWVVSGSHDTTVKLWDSATGGEIRTFPGDGGWI